MKYKYQYFGTVLYSFSLLLLLVIQAYDKIQEIVTTCISRKQIREGSQKKDKSVGLEPPFAKTTPLIVKYIHKGNIHYLVEKQWLKNICNKKTTLKHGMVEDHTFTFFGTLP